MDAAWFTSLLKKEMVPALGCTGPTAYALAAACCRPWLTSVPREVRLYLSPGFLKIGFGVATPGTSRPGIEIPAALGLIAGDWRLGLYVLSSCGPEDMEKAIMLADSGTIHVLCDHEKAGVYVRCEVITDNERVVSVVERTHDGVSLIQVNDSVKYKSPAGEAADDRIGTRAFTLGEMFEYVDLLDPGELEFLLEGYLMDIELARDGIRRGFGMGSGRARLKEYWKGRTQPADLFDDPMIYLPEDIRSRAGILVSAASDARMGGSRFPAMAAMGDGNQGLTAMLPVGIAGEMLKKDKGEIIRALALSCLMLCYIKTGIGRESAFCLCSIAASAGAAAGISYLRGQDRHVICVAVKNVISTLCGMLCDGAKNSCALKMATACDAAFFAAELAAAGLECGFYDGVADDTLEQTVSCIADIAVRSTDMLDRLMVENMIKKVSRRASEDKAPSEGS